MIAYIYSIPDNKAARICGLCADYIVACGLAYPTEDYDGCKGFVTPRALVELVPAIKSYARLSAKQTLH